MRAVNQCAICGERNIDPLDLVTLHDGFGRDDWMHPVYEQDHHPSCYGNCVEMNCPVLIEILCGPVRFLGHGGKLGRDHRQTPDYDNRLEVVRR